VPLQKPPQPLPNLSLASQGRVLFFSEQGKALGQVDLKEPIQAMVSSPLGDVLYVALRERPQIAVLGVASRRLRYLGLTDEAGSLEFAAGRLFCLQQNGQLAVFEKIASREKSLPTQNLEGISAPLSLRVRADSKEFLVIESNRLLLLGMGQSQAWESWTHPQLVSALGVDTQVVASLRDGFLQLLSPSLAPLGRHPLPSGAGRTQLYPNSYRRQFWSLHSEGVLGLWNHPEVNLSDKLDLAIRPVAATDDPQGRLWVLGDQGELVRVDAEEALRSESVARLKLSTVDALVYLHHPQGKATSR